MKDRGGLGRAAALCAVAVVLAMGLVGPAAAAGAAVPRAAERAALRALGNAGRQDPGAALLLAARPVPAAGAVEFLRLGIGAAADPTGIVSAPLALALRAPSGEPAWLFYEDRAPKALPEHDGRVVLVGVRDGAARVSGVIPGPPVLDGQVPRLRPAPSGAGPAHHGAAPAPWPSSGGSSSLVVPPGRSLAAARLAADHVCFAQVADTLGRFGPYLAADRSAAAVGFLAKRLGAIAPGLVSDRYRRGSGASIADHVRGLIDGDGCREVSLYVAGGGYREGGEAAIAVGVHLGGGRVSTQLLTVEGLRGLLRSRPQVQWDLTVDAPHAGAFLDALSGEPNLASAQVSGRLGDASYIARSPGRPHREMLGFTRALLGGLRATLADEGAVAAAIADRQAGRAPSVLAALLSHSFDLAVPAGPFARLGVQPQRFLRATSPGGGPLGTGGGAPSAPGSGAPVDRPLPVDLPPAVVASLTDVGYVENEPAVTIDPGVAVADADSAGLTGATVRVASGYTAGADVLEFSDQAGIHGSWDAASGVLTLSGNAAPAAYQAALRTVGYRNDSEAPVPGPRTISFAVDDGHSASVPATVDVEVTAENDAPELDLPAATPLAYTENDPATAIDPSLTVGDPDSADLASATVKIASGLQAAEDRLELTTPVAGIAASYDEATGALTLTGPATLADFQTALRAVAYRNLSEDPDPSTRTVTVQAEDTDGAATPVRSREITVAAVNDAPTVTATATALAYAENDPATALDPGLVVTDPDSANLTGATVQIGAGYVEGEDVLACAGGGGITASWDAASGELTLSGAATAAAYQAALRTVTYENLSDDPPAGPRSVSIRASDGSDESAAAERTVAVTGADDAPDVTLAATPLAYTENDPATAIDPSLTVGDPDSADLASATVKIASGLQAAEDRLELTIPVAGIAASYDEATGALTLTGPATLADFQTALRAVAYRNLSEDPDPSARTVSFTLTDGEGTTGPSRSRGLVVTAVNDAPSAAADEGSTDEATPLAAAAPGVLGNDTDPEGSPLTVVAVDGQAADVGVATSTAKGAALTLDADGSYTYDPTGSATLRALGEGESTTDTFTYAASDGEDSDTATVTITVEGLPDPPEAANDSYGGVGNTTLTVGQPGPSGEAFEQLSGSVLDNDTDADTPANELTVTAGTVATTLGGSATIAADGTFAYTPPTGVSGSTDSFDYTVSDGAQDDTGTVSIALAGRVWYVDNEAGAGGSGRSDGPLDTLAAAATASSAGDTIYVFHGDGGSTGQNAGVALKANQRLIGEADDLVVGGETLFDGSAAQRPKIGNSAGIGVTLASGSRVEGVEVSASGGAAISGGSGVAGSTIADVVAGGSAGGVLLNGTSGAFAVSDLAIATSGGTGLGASSAGTVQLAEAGTISIASTGGKALDVSGTALSGAIDSVSVPSSASGGVSLQSTTGSLSLGGVSITTSAGTGFFASGAAGLSIPAAGTANVSSTGGPAVDIRSSSSPALSFDSVSSTNSSGPGFNVDTVSGGSVTAAAGTIAGAAGAAVDVNAGNGAVTYAGTVDDGNGRPAEVTGRTGGAVTISGSIAEDDTGILVSGNSGGSTEFSGGSKSISTGAGNAVTLTNNTGHTVNFTGGGLALTTTTGKGFAATGGGAVTVQGTGNTIASTTGTALEVQSTTIGSGGLTFRSISANGGANGIFLSSTGASGGLTVTGNGSAESGGVIQSTVGADGSTAGVGAYLNSTKGVSLSRMRFTTNQGHAIRGSSVDGFSLLNSTVNGTNGTNDSFNEGSVALTGLTGTSSISETTIEGGYEDNLDVETSSGALDLSISKVTIGANSTSFGGNGMLLTAEGTANLTATVSESHFTSSREDLFQHIAQGQSTSDLTFSGNELSNSHPNKVTGGAGILVEDAGTEGAELTYRITGNSVRGTLSHAIMATKLPGIGAMRGRIANNTVGAVGSAKSGSQQGSGIAVEARGQGSHTVAITGNTVRHYFEDGIKTVGGEVGASDNGTVSFDITASGNVVTEPESESLAGFRNEVADPNSHVTMCLDLQGNTLTGSGVLGTDIRVFNDFPQTVFKLPGYGGGAQDGTAVANYLAARNTATTKFASTPGSGNGYSSTTACAQPPA